MKKIMIIYFSLLMILTTHAYIHDVHINSDDRPFFYISNFGFLKDGKFIISLSSFSASGSLNATKQGFFVHVSETDASQLLDVFIKDSCVLELPANTNQKKVNLTYAPKDINIEVTDVGLYNLFFINCDKSSVSFTMTIIQFNMIDGVKSYLPAGITNLPSILGSFTGVYCILALIWVFGGMRGKEKAQLNAVHYMMTALIFLKVLSMFSKSVEYHNLKVYGKAEGWNIPFYIFAFCKGVILFLIIGLIGMGYTFFKNFLSDRDRKILMVVLPLQIIANVAQIEATEGSWGSIEWKAWTTVFQVVDVVCCFAVIGPIALSIKHLRDASQTDGKAAISVAKMQLFRQFYLIVFVYLYFTRIVVVFTKLAVPFTLEWLNYVFEELATIGFYSVLGYKFRPQEQSYFKVDDEVEMEIREKQKQEKDETMNNE